ncbi:MAG TPA: response regulator [Cyclobacteriaceae bacterium]|jgi:PAS domain S-box-containing protein|nr:response regulator [Cyclobacteriaceae bacterium]
MLKNIPLTDNSITQALVKNMLPAGAKNIHSGFQLAKMIVTKVEQIDQQKQKVILVADDEPLTFELITEFFDDANIDCRIVRADTGRKAYHLALEEIPDLIISDWIMPEFDGPDLIKKLKANPATENIPVIITTGAVFPEKEFNKVLTTGAIDYIQKPIDERELIARTKTAFALSESLRGVKHSKESLQAKSQFLTSLLDDASNPIFYLDRLGCLLGCNQDFENLIGRRRAELLGKTVFEFFPEFYATDLDRSFSTLRGLGTVNQCELNITDGLGHTKNLLLSYVGFGSTSIEIVIGIIADVTNLRVGG